MGLHQSKTLHTIKEAIIKTKGQTTEWDKIFVNLTLDKGLISKTYKEFIKLNNNKKQKPTQLKMGRGPK